MRFARCTEVQILPVLLLFYLLRCDQKHQSTLLGFKMSARHGSKQSDIPVTIKSWLNCGCSERLCHGRPAGLSLGSGLRGVACSLELNGLIGGTVTRLFPERLTLFFSSRQLVFVFTKHVCVGVGPRECFCRRRVSRCKMSQNQSDFPIQDSSRRVAL